jgi:hypothetical protein
MTRVGENWRGDQGGGILGGVAFVVFFVKRCNEQV